MKQLQSTVCSQAKDILELNTAITHFQSIVSNAAKFEVENSQLQVSLLNLKNGFEKRELDLLSQLKEYKASAIVLFQSHLMTEQLLR